jgi:Mn-dependent DtxR family transcriptional regulator
MKPWLEHSDISTDEIVRLYRDEKISVKAVAKRLDINPKTVLSRLSRCGTPEYDAYNNAKQSG